MNTIWYCPVCGAPLLPFHSTCRGCGDVYVHILRFFFFLLLSSTRSVTYVSVRRRPSGTMLHFGAGFLDGGCEFGCSAGCSSGFAGAVATHRDFPYH